MSPVYGLFVAPRQYECTVCGFKLTVSTNHTGTCLSHCRNCSWRGGVTPEGEVYSPGYRVVKYVGPEVTAEEHNPHAHRA